jgi:multidrug transporter EmrE-like cation transporter
MTALNIRIWLSILFVAVTAVTGDILTARAMRDLGDLDDIRARSGILGAARAVTGSSLFLLGVLAMAFSFFGMLFALSPPAPVSLIFPATAALTFVGNVCVAQYFLKENVDARRWFAAILICAGVFLLSKE